MADIEGFCNQDFRSEGDSIPVDELNESFPEEFEFQFAIKNRFQVKFYCEMPTTVDLERQVVLFLEPTNVELKLDFEEEEVVSVDLILSVAKQCYQRWMGYKMPTQLKHLMEDELISIVHEDN